MKPAIRPGSHFAAATKSASLLLTVLGVSILFWPTPSSAQTTVGTILGSISDSSGAVIPNVPVTVTNTGTGITRNVTTDGLGFYQVPNLLPGKYSITAEVPGFRRALITDVVLQVNQEARYNIVLEVGEVSEQVSVVAEGAQVQTDDATLGQVVDQKKVVELPLNGRNFLQLLTIGTGAAPILESAPGGGAITGETNRPGLSYTISGQREVSMSYLVDGVEAKSEFEMMAAIAPSLDAIQEFKLQRNAFSAQFGAAPALVNIAIKSGTNEFHGSVYEFLRNDKLDSSQFQDPIVDGNKQKAPFRMNQYGASIGGPIIKNRSFFFFNYEALRRRRFGQFTAVAIPTRFRNGDLSTLQDPSGNPTPVFDPDTYTSATGQREQFPNNTIPSTRFDPLAVGVLQLFPAPQNESAQFGDINTVVARNIVRDDDQINVRGDHHFSDNTTIFGRYSWYDSPILDPNNYAEASTENFLLRDKNLAIGVTHIFSPQTLNEFRFGYNNDQFDVAPFWEGGNITEELGIQNLDPVESQYGPPSVGFVNFSGVGPYGWDIVSGGKLFQYNDVLTMIRGRHTIKTGVEIRDMRPWSLAEDTARRGTFSFTGEFTAQLASGAVVPSSGSDFADLLLGLPKNSQGGVGSTYTEFDWTNTHVFIQDDFRVSPGLTLSYGLRYEYNMQGKPRDGKLEGFCVTCIDQGLPGQLLLTDTGGVRSQVVDPDWNNFAPRVGFAWSFLGNQDTVLRGGFGTFFDNTKGDELNFRQHHPDKTQLSEPINENPLPTFFMRNAFPKPPPGFNADPFTVDPKDQWPRILQWNVNIQHRFMGEWLMEVGYVGSHGTNQSKRWNLNQARLDEDPLNPTPINSRVPFPRFGTLLASNKRGRSNYNGLQIRVEKTYSNGFHFITGYTFSRCQDMDSSASFAADNQNVNDFEGDYGLCGFQAKQRFNITYGWELPFGKNLQGVAGKLAKGWQINSIMQFQDGSPFTPRRSGDPARVGRRYEPRFDRICDGNLSDSEQTVDRFFDTSCFVPSQEGTFGSSGRNVVFGPGFKSIDFSLFKNTPVTERIHVQFRTEIFNAFNNTNYTQPGRSEGFSFGKIFSEGEAREIQFGLKVIF